MTKLIAAIVNFCRRFFLRSVESRREPFHVPPKKARRQSSKSNLPETLGELLEDIEATFGALRLPDNGMNWVGKKERKGLRNLGVHIPSPWLWRWHHADDIIIDTSKRLPTMLCVSTRWVAERKEGFVYPEIAFAIKLAKLPALVTQHPGVPYQFGYAQTSNDKALRGDLLWGRCFITIERNGRINFCDELQFKSISIPVKNQADRRVFGSRRLICTKGWNRPLLLSDRVDATTNKDMPWAKTRIAEKNVIWNIFEYWRRRPERWQVAVLHGKDRITFGIDSENTKIYFSDRDKTIKAADGKAKRIIHHVSTHQRTYPSGKTVTVKEHIRGICEFDWRGYHCLVTAPAFNGQLMTALFDAAPVEDEDHGGTMIELPELGKSLADAETPRNLKIAARG